MLVVSFIALGALWKTPQLERHATGRDLGASFSRFVLGPVRIAVQAISVVLFVRRARRGALRHRPTRSRTSRRRGSTSSSGSACRSSRCCSATSGGRSAPGARSPTRSSGSGRRRVVRRGRSPHTPSVPGAIPERSRCSRSSRSSSATPIPSNPRALAFAIASLLVRRALRHGRVRPRDLDASGARASRSCSPTSRGSRRSLRVDGRIRLRLPLTGLAGAEPVPGIDRLSRRRPRLGRLRRLQPHDHVAGPPRSRRGAVHPRPARNGGAPRHGRQPRRAHPRHRVRAPRLSRRLLRSPGRWWRRRGSLVPEFVLSLVPIALVYAVAHYFSLFVIQGQFIAPLALRSPRAGLGSLRHGGRAARHRRS